MKASDILKELGYTENEARAYLALLKMGEGTVADVARQVEMPRTTTKDLLGDMRRKGLVNFYVKRKRKIWVSENPEKLLKILKIKEDLFAEGLPVLKRMMHGSVQKPRVHVLQGAQEIKEIMDEMILSRSNILGVLAWDEWIDLFGQPYVDDFVERRVRANLSISLISPRTPLSTALKRNDSKELRHTKFLPSGLELQTSNFIFGDKFALVSLNRTLPVAVLIQDQAIAHTLTLFFEAMWMQATE